MFILLLTVTYIITVILCHIIAYIKWILCDKYGETLEDMYKYFKEKEFIIISLFYLPVVNIYLLLNFLVEILYIILIKPLMRTLKICYNFIKNLKIR